MSLLFSGLGMVRTPVKPFSQDAYRYVREIERAFEGQSPQDVLLDVGTWVYLMDGVIMKDRAPSIGERGYSETGDFSGIIGRLQKKHYSKILVRNLDSPDFWYDHHLWCQSSGIKQALLENYHEAGRIMGVSRQEHVQHSYLFSDISILVPNPH
jgi:hypothetical protein